MARDVTEVLKLRYLKYQNILLLLHQASIANKLHLKIEAIPKKNQMNEEA